MTDQPEHPDETSNAREASRSAVARVNVCLPCTVESYDAVRQTVTVKLVPLFRRRDPSQGGKVVTYAPPVLHNLPVSFPSSGDYSDTWPIAVGSVGRVIVADRSMDEWKSTAAARTTPQDRRRHDLTDAFFDPVHRSPHDPLPAAAYHATARVLRGPELRLGSSAATQAVALAPLVQADSVTLEAALATASAAAIAAAPLTPGDGGAGAFAAFAASLVTTLAAWPSAVGATKVNAE